MNTRPISSDWVASSRISAFWRQRAVSLLSEPVVNDRTTWNFDREPVDIVAWTMCGLDEQMSGPCPPVFILSKVSFARPATQQVDEPFGPSYY